MKPTRNWAHPLVRKTRLVKKTRQAGASGDSHDSTHCCGRFCSVAPSGIAGARTGNDGSSGCDVCCAACDACGSAHGKWREPTGGPTSSSRCTRRSENRCVAYGSADCAAEHGQIQGDAATFQPGRQDPPARVQHGAGTRIRHTAPGGDVRTRGCGGGTARSAIVFLLPLSGWGIYGERRTGRYRRRGARGGADL